jgi:putative ABC transport system permease protein
MAAAFLITLFIFNENSFDSSWADEQKIYKLESTFRLPGKAPSTSSFTPGIVQPALAGKFPEVKKSARLFYSSRSFRAAGNLFEENFAFVDPEFIEIFELDFIEGSQTAALDRPDSVILSESMALKFYGSGLTLGKTLVLKNGAPLKVTGVYRDIPLESHLSLGLITKFDPDIFSSFRRFLTDSWSAAMLHTYVKLASGAGPADFTANLSTFVARSVPRDSNYEPNWLELTPILVGDLHLNGAEIGAIKPRTKPVLLLAFGAIAFFTLMIATINFVNYSIATASYRSREVGLRKVLGAKHKDITKLFLGEAALLVGVAILFSAMIVELTLPYFQQFVRVTIESRWLSDPYFVLSLIGVMIVFILSIGIFPASMMANVKASAALSARTRTGGSLGRTRTVLVIAQFSISIAMIAATILVSKQIDYANSLTTGYQRENILILRGLNRSYSDLRLLRDELLKHPALVDAGPSSQLLTSETFGIDEIVSGDDQEAQYLPTFPVGFGFFETYGVKPISGRLFAPDRALDVAYRLGSWIPEPQASVIINQQALKLLGLGSSSDAIGKTIKKTHPGGTSTLQVIGVVPDIKLGSARSATKPMLYFIDEGRLFNLSLRVRPGMANAATEHIAKVWQSIKPETPIRLEVFSQILSRLYANENRLNKILMVFSGLAILISCTGLFALASLTTKARVQEIGVRKTLGASSFDIVKLLIWEFSTPVLVANLLAWPVAGYFMSEWLKGFAYRIELSPLPFIMAGLAALFVAWATTAGHAWRVARSSPIHALRYE